MNTLKKSILIINSAGARGSHPDVIKRQATFLPYSTAVIVSRLRNRGFNVIHNDFRNSVTPALSGQLFSDDFDKWLITDQKTALMQEYLEKSINLLPDLSTVGMLGISIFTHNNYPYALSLAKEIKSLNSSVPICLGGCFVTIKNLDLPGYVDFFIKGNGGDPALHLANHFINGVPLESKTPGLIFRNRGKIKDTGKNQEPAESEETPDFSDLDIKQYLRNIPPKVLRIDIDSEQEILSIPYRTSLGCYGTCTFCTGRLVDKLRFKSVEKVVTEIKGLIGLHENVLIRFCDSSINNNPKIIAKVFDILLNENIRFNWNGYVKASNISFDLLEKFAKSGCNLLAWGLESASPHMINVFNKKIDLEDTEKYIKKSAELGIQNVIFIIINGPGEDEDDLKATEKFIRNLLKNKNITFQLNDFMLEENTTIFNNPDKYGIEIAGRPRRNLHTEREKIKWKETDLTEEAFEAKQKHHNRFRRRLRFYQQTVQFLQGKGIKLPEPITYYCSKAFFPILEFIGKA